MKTLLILFSICSLSVTAAFSQNAELQATYNGDEASVTIKSQEAPPPLRVYVQPACPIDGYIWTPGYWGFGDLKVIIG